MGDNIIKLHKNFADNHQEGLEPSKDAETNLGDNVVKLHKESDIAPEENPAPLSDAQEHLAEGLSICFACVAVPAYMGISIAFGLAVGYGAVIGIHQISPFSSLESAQLVYRLTGIPATAAVAGLPMYLEFIAKKTQMEKAVRQAARTIVRKLSGPS